MPRHTTQLTLSLPAPRRWGGRRDGAGRKPGPNPGMRHRSRVRFRTLPAHVTLRLRPGLPSLRNTRVVRAIERSFADGCQRGAFRLVHYSLQGNHAHLIVEASDRDTLGRGMMAIGSRLARAVNRVARRRRGQVLADRYHVRLLKTPREVHRALGYVLLNARRHASKAKKTLRSVVRLDPASSGLWFDGWNREGLDAAKRLLAERSAEAHASSAVSGRPAVARARTWLLNVGWRRHGLLDPADVPG